MVLPTFENMALLTNNQSISSLLYQVLAIICIMSSVGLVTGFFLKHLDSVLKAVASALEAGAGLGRKPLSDGTSVVLQENSSENWAFPRTKPSRPSLKRPSLHKKRDPKANSRNPPLEQIAFVPEHEKKLPVV